MEMERDMKYWKKSCEEYRGMLEVANIERDELRRKLEIIEKTCNNQLKGETGSLRTIMFHILRVINGLDTKSWL